MADALPDDASGLPVERVADYPRPPALERVSAILRIRFNGCDIAETGEAWRVLETTHPPTYYLPRSAFRHCALEPSPRRSFCEWKGEAGYWSIRAGDALATDCAWSYPAPVARFAAITDHLAVYPAAMEACFVGDLAVSPQPGRFYGGWVTPNLIGPFKGAPGTLHW